MSIWNIISNLHFVVRSQPGSLDPDGFVGNDIKKVGIEVDSVVLERGTFEWDVGSYLDEVS